MPQVSPRILSILDQVEESVVDLADVRTLPRECYADAEFYEFEKEAVFARSWLCLGRADTVPNPGDFVRIDVGDEPLVIVRDQNMDIRVVSAVCAHRGHIVCEGTGNTGKLFRCPLHAWAYGLDGRLLAAPSMSKTVPMDVLKSEAYLAPLKVELWNGFIFANMDPDAAPLRPSLHKLEKVFEPYHMDEMVSMPTLDIPGNRWNWKGMLENGIEPYHTASLHITIHDFAHVRLASFAEWDDDDGAIFHPTGFYHIDGGFNASERAYFPAISTLSDEDRQRVVFATMPPTLFMGAMPDYVFYYLVLPTGPETMTLRIGMCYPPETTRLPMFEHLHKATVDGIVMYNDQDTRADESVQRGMRSRFRRPGRYSFQEETLVQQNRWLLKRYRAYIDEVMGAAAPRTAAAVGDAAHAPRG
jgi:phenylpropionate dioxygenase-like ring-hydroxylating dioxygenase large terminal subunit